MSSNENKDQSPETTSDSEQSDNESGNNDLGKVAVKPSGYPENHKELNIKSEISMANKNAAKSYAVLLEELQKGVQELKSKIPVCNKADENWGSEQRSPANLLSKIQSNHQSTDCDESSNKDPPASFSVGPTGRNQNRQEVPNISKEDLSCFGAAALTPTEYMQAAKSFSNCRNSTDHVQSSEQLWNDFLKQQTISKPSWTFTTLGGDKTDATYSFGQHHQKVPLYLKEDSYSKQFAGSEGKPHLRFQPKRTATPSEEPNSGNKSEHVLIKKSDLVKIIQNVSKNATTTKDGDHSSKSSRMPTKIDCSTKLGDFRPLGNFEKVMSNQEVYKIISTYVNSSHDIPEGFGEVKIHNIYCIEKKQFGSKSVQKQPGQSKHQILLFFKTNPKSIKRLADDKDSCVAFYDRIARAFAVPVGDLVKPLRQIILLCSVSMGTKKSSKNGYSFWSKHGFPIGHDSVKGTGKLTPVWEGNQEVGNGIMVPCGKTREDKRFDSYDLKYSEYILWERRRIKVRYAVDVEIVPKEQKHNKVDETAKLCKALLGESED